MLSIYMERERKYKSLRHAAGAGHAAAVQRFLNSGSKAGELGNAPLRWALRHRRAKIVGILIAAGANPVFNFHEFVGIIANNCDNTSAQIIQKYLQNCNTLPVFSQKLTAAMASGKLRREERIFAADYFHVEGVEAASEAVRVESPEIIRQLHSEGVNVNEPNGEPLKIAIESGNLDVVKCLISCGANVNYPANHSLPIAIQCGHAEIAEHLIEAGATLAFGAQIADVALKDSIDTLSLLLDNNYDAQLKHNVKKVVFAAVENDARLILDFVLNQGLADEATLAEALDYAAHFMKPEIVDILLSYKADPNFYNGMCLTEAFEQQEFGIAKKLIAAGALVRDVEADLSTLTVRRLVRENEWDFLRFLLSHGIETAALGPKGLGEDGKGAIRFFQELKPDDLIKDVRGDLHPLDVLEERKRLVKSAADIAKDISAYTSKTALCLAGVMDAIRLRQRSA